MRKLLFILLLLSVDSEASAVNWVHMGETTELYGFVDITSIHHVGNLLQYSEKEIYKTPRQYVNPPHKLIDFAVYRVHVNCAAQKHAMTSEIIYFVDGTAATVPGNGIFVPVLPGTISDTMTQFVCSFQQGQKAPKARRPR